MQLCIFDTKISILIQVYTAMNEEKKKNVNFFFWGGGTQFCNKCIIKKIQFVLFKEVLQNLMFMGIKK